MYQALVANARIIQSAIAEVYAIVDVNKSPKPINFWSITMPKNAPTEDIAVLMPSNILKSYNVQLSFSLVYIYSKGIVPQSINTAKLLARVSSSIWARPLFGRRLKHSWIISFTNKPSKIVVIPPCNKKYKLMFTEQLFCLKNDEQMSAENEQAGVGVSFIYTISTVIVLSQYDCPYIDFLFQGCDVSFILREIQIVRKNV